MPQTFSPLQPDDLANLDAKREWVAGHLTEGANPGFDDVRTKLNILTAVIDNGWVRPDETVKLQALGVVFGDVLASIVNAPWAMVEDEWGRDPCLLIDESRSIALFPMTMISKRVEAGEQVDVMALLSASVQQALEMREG